MKDKKDTVTVNAEHLADKAKKWVTSSEGERALQEGLQRATQTTAELKEARRVDPKTLHEPFTL